MECLELLEWADHSIYSMAFVACVFLAAYRTDCWGLEMETIGSFWETSGAPRWVLPVSSIAHRVTEDNL